LIIVGIILGFLAFAIATLRTDSQSQHVGVLLLAPAAIFAVNFVRVLVLGTTTPTWAPFVLGSGQALALLAIGYSLRTEGVSTDHREVESSPDSAAR
jgi:exosortase/archaeosortase family protein